MARDRDAWIRARDIESRFRESLRALAAADEDGFGTALEAVRNVLSEYETIRVQADGASLPWPPDMDERLATVRLELQRLQAGEVSRRYGVGKIRLAIPHLPEPEAEDPPPGDKGRPEDGPRDGDPGGTSGDAP